MSPENAILLDKHKDILSFRDLTPGTVATYVSYMTSFIDWVETNHPGLSLKEISWGTIREYIRYLKGPRNLANRSINPHLAQLHDFWYYVLHKEWDKREVPYLKFDVHLPLVPTREQVKTIIDSIENPKHKAEIVLLYSSGIRISELIRLRCKDIRRANHQIYVSTSKNRQDRYAILAENAIPVLIDYVKSSYRGAKPDDWLFPGQKVGSHISDQSVYMTFVRQAAACGYADEGFNLHSLRHAFALHLYDKGYDLMSIKEALGHKSLNSTLVYVTLGIGNGRSVTSPYDFS